VAAPEDPAIRGRLSTFGGGDRSDALNMTAAAVLEQYWDPTPNASFLLGLNAATGRAFLPCPTEPCALGGPRDLLLGGDLYLKWQPPNTEQTYAAFQWTTEYFARVIDGVPTEGALYSEPVLRIARRWHAGARFDLTGLPDGPTCRGGTGWVQP
jgi:hypothetical protein